MAEKFFTTNNVASMFGVTPATVVNWVNKGRLRAHRTPGGHRRISGSSIVAFARSNTMKVPREAIGDERLRVLVVDDEADFGELIQDFLVAAGGFEVTTADSGFQAGFAVASFNPHLILMDIMMPDMNGFEVHDRLKADPATSHIPIIACTAYGDPGLDAQISSHQFDGYIAKPLRLTRLLEMIRERFQA